MGFQNIDRRRLAHAVYRFVPDCRLVFLDRVLDRALKLFNALSRSSNLTQLSTASAQKHTTGGSHMLFAATIKDEELNNLI